MHGRSNGSNEDLPGNDNRYPTSSRQTHISFPLLRPPFTSSSPVANKPKIPCNRHLSINIITHLPTIHHADQPRPQPSITRLDRNNLPPIQPPPPHNHPIRRPIRPHHHPTIPLPASPPQTLRILGLLIRRLANNIRNPLPHPGRRPHRHPQTHIQLTHPHPPQPQPPPPQRPLLATPPTLRRMARPPWPGKRRRTGPHLRMPAVRMRWRATGTRSEGGTGSAGTGSVSDRRWGI